MSELRRLVTGRSLGVVAVALVAVLALTGCATKFTGGGQLPSADPSDGDRATFGFTFRVIEDDGTTGTARMRGTYHDGPVRLRFRDLAFAFTGDDGPDACMTAAVPYESQRREAPGTGVAVVVACDGGELGTDDDGLLIEVITGPYAGYGNAGLTTGGNLQAHP